ncbi:MAG: putative zinc-binding protein [Armatimonadota bacterium]
MKVCLQPCLGINRPASTVGRQACYLAHEALLGPERSDLGCAPALYAEVEEDIEFIRHDPVIAVESCEKRCACHLVAEKGETVAASVMVQEVLRAAGFDPEALPLEHLDIDHPAVKAVAEEICRIADELLA